MHLRQDRPSRSPVKMNRAVMFTGVKPMRSRKIFRITAWAHVGSSGKMELQGTSTSHGGSVRLPS
jgi:hypothetical protein